MKGDLHIHSNFSDSNYSLEDIILKAKKSDLNYISITDHDTISGNEEAVLLGLKHDITVIPGIEISCYDFKRRRKVHILGYGKLGRHTENLCRDIGCRRHNLSKKLCRIIKEKGYDISWERIKSYSGRSGVFKQHIMLDLIKMGYTDKIYGELYTKLFKEENPLPELDYIDVHDAINAIRKDGGFVVLAHPMAYKNLSLIPEIAHKIHGIEVYHPKHSEDDIEHLLEIAENYNLIATGGSDFHGELEDCPVHLGQARASKESLNFIISNYNN